MITIFATPKDFKGLFKTIQINALRSWRFLSPDIQIIIFGDSIGSKEVASEIKAEYIPNVQCSPQGTPILSDMFEKAEKNAKFSTLTFINSDIILPRNFLSAVKICKEKYDKFLMVGHRWDIDVEELIDYNDKRKRKAFIDKLGINSIQHPCTGIDYFVYKKYQWGGLPNFIIGRPGYDNWLIWKARRNLVPVIDASNIIKVFHQNHNFIFHNITSDPKINPEPEGLYNREIINDNTLNLLDCTFKLVGNKIEKNKTKNFKIRNLYRLPKIFPEFAILIKLYRRLYNLFYE
tara:strand:- start:10 stop:882 length:873 start_codon:yes stop_codon:yes gene_type:complete